MDLCAFALVNRLINVKNGVILQKTTQVKNFFRTAHGQFAVLKKRTANTLLFGRKMRKFLRKTRQMSCNFCRQNSLYASKTQ